MSGLKQKLHNTYAIFMRHVVSQGLGMMASLYTKMLAVRPVVYART